MSTNETELLTPLNSWLF